MIILAIAEAHVRDVTDFGRYIVPDPAYATDAGKPRAWVILAHIGRLLQKNPHHKIVSIQNIQLDKAGTETLLEIVYLAGHGTVGAIGFKDMMSTDDVYRHIYGAFSDHPELVKSIGSVFVSSCEAARETLHMSSIIDRVRTAFERAAQSDREIPVIKIPEVRGCLGFSLVHPDPTWPVVQVDRRVQKSTYLTFQYGIEKRHAANIAQANKLIKRNLLSFGAEKVQPDKKMRALKVTSVDVAGLLREFYTDLIIEAYKEGYLSTDGFTPDGLECKITDIADDKRSLKFDVALPGVTEREEPAPGSGGGGGGGGGGDVATAVVEAKKPGAAPTWIHQSAKTATAAAFAGAPDAAAVAAMSDTATPVAASTTVPVAVAEADDADKPKKGECCALL